MNVRRWLICQNVEIVALRMQVKSLQERLAHVDEQAKALENRRDGAAREAERALSKNASELGKLTSVLEETLGAGRFAKSRDRDTKNAGPNATGMALRG